VCIRAHWNSKCTSETEVSKFEIIPFIDEKILRLEVTMQDAMGMTVKQTTTKLVSEFLYSSKVRQSQDDDKESSNGLCHEGYTTRNTL